MTSVAWTSEASAWVDEKCMPHRLRETSELGKQLQPRRWGLLLPLGFRLEFTRVQTSFRHNSFWYRLRADRPAPHAHWRAWPRARFFALPTVKLPARPFPEMRRKGLADEDEEGRMVTMVVTVATRTHVRTRIRGHGKLHCYSTRDGNWMYVCMYARIISIEMEVCG